MNRRPSCRQPEGAECVAFGKGGSCRLCTDFTKVSAAASSRQKARHKAEMAWLPAHLVPDYHYLAKRMPAAEARREIEAMIAGDPA